MTDPFQFTMLEREQILALSQASLYEDSDDAREAFEYLKSTRKIDKETLVKFNIGYVPVRVSNRRISGKIIFPIYDSNENIVAISTRDFRNTNNNRGHWHESYVKKHHLFGWKQSKDEIKRTRQIIVVEGQFDAMAMHSSGFCNTVGILGSHPSFIQTMMFCRYADEIVLAFDGDSAGEKAFDEAVNTLYSSGIMYDKTISYFRLDLGLYEDPDDLIKNAGREEMEMQIELSRKVKKNNDAAQWSTDVSNFSID
jgi:DNA primase